MKTKIFLFSAYLLFLLLGTKVYSQKEVEKKIIQLIDSDKFNETLQNSKQYLLNLNEAEKLAENCDCDSLKIELYLVMGEELALVNKKYKNHIAKAIEIAKKNNDLKSFVKIYNFCGQIEYELESGKAVYYYQNALNYAKQINNPFYCSSVYMGLGTAFLSFDQRRKAQTYFLLALKEANRIKNFNKEEIDLYNPKNLKAYIYTYLTMTLTDTQKSYHYIKTAHKIINKLDDALLNREVKKTVYIQLVNLNIKFKALDEALTNNTKLYELAKKENDAFFLIASYLNFSFIYYYKNQYENAATYMKLFIDNTVRSNRDKMYRYKRHFASINEKLGNWKAASAYYKSEMKNLDSLLLNKKNKIHEELTIKYETEQKKVQIANQKLIINNQESFQHRLIFFVILFFVLIFGAILYYTINQKNKKKLVDLELKKEKEFNIYRTEFLENISHEIRTPLTLLNGYLDLALEKEDFENCRKNIKKAKKSSASVLQNANDLLNLLSPDKNLKQINNTVFKLEPFVKRIFYSFDSATEINKITLQFNCNLPKNFSVFSDKAKVEKILNNLIGNALKYSFSETTIQLSITHNQNQVMIKIKDQGFGISNTEKDKIFDRFYQSNENQSSGGFGIGLSLSKELALLLNGNIILESEINKGSEFCLTLPYDSMVQLELENTNESDEMKKVSKPSIPILIPIENQKPSILIVEDNIEMCAYYKEILSERYQCYFANDGQAGIKIAQKQRFDLVLSDIMMPKMNGFEFKKLLKLNLVYTNVPFVFVTARGLLEDKIIGLGLGIDEYITKPFDKNELIARLNNLIENAKSRALWIKENPELIAAPREIATTTILNQFKKMVIENIANENITVNFLAQKLNYSQRKLFNCIKEATGMSLIQLILEIRLTEAYRLIQSKEYQTLNEVRYAVGINSPSYFNKTFKQRFGLNPSEMLKE